MSSSTFLERFLSKTESSETKQNDGYVPPADPWAGENQDNNFYSEDIPF